MTIKHWSSTSKSFLLLLFSIFSSSVLGLDKAASAPSTLSQAAEKYVHLGLELGQYDKDYVDAYLGPKEWREQAENPRPKGRLVSDIAKLSQDLEEMEFSEPKQIVRHKALVKNVRAMDVRARMANGEKFSFAEEARLIYDVQLPEYDFATFDSDLAQINKLLPGGGDLAERVDTFRARFNIPKEKLAAVISAAMLECRKRSKKFIPMPEHEAFTLEYVSDKSWSGYNWYQGHNISFMQINQDIPTKIDGAIGLGCHEGYPGHHVWNVLIEEELVKANDWIEHSLYPLFSPYGVIAEGSANYGVSLAFPGNERVEFEKAVLYPLAGLDAADAELLEQINTLMDELKYSRIAIGQLYLDGDITREEAVKKTIKYSLVSKNRAETSIRFLEQYRAYILNYSIGEDLIKDYIAKRSDTEKERWAQFQTVLTELKSASELLN